MTFTITLYDSELSTTYPFYVCNYNKAQCSQIATNPFTNERNNDAFTVMGGPSGSNQCTYNGSTASLTSGSYNVDYTTSNHGACAVTNK